MKDFRVYVLHSNILAYVLTIVLKDILVKRYNDGKRCTWMVKIQEYDMEVNPTKLVKGQGFVIILSQSNFHALGINLLTEEDEEGAHPMIKIVVQKIHIKYETYGWYQNVIHYLTFLRCPAKTKKSKYQALRAQAHKFVISNGKQ